MNNKDKKLTYEAPKVSKLDENEYVSGKACTDGSGDVQCDTGVSAERDCIAGSGFIPVP